jgi:hypothetical protein
MGTTSGYIKLHRRILDWEWYGNPNTRAVFIHILLTVNWEPKQWSGMTIQPGQRVMTVAALAAENRLSVKQIRTCLNNLERTGELAIRTTNHYSLITVMNWALYQSDEETTANATAYERSDNRQTKGNPRAITKEIEEIEELEERKKKPSSEFENALKAFREMRTVNRKKLTASAEQMILKKLQQLAPDNEHLQAEILNQSTMNSWLGVFPLKADRGKGPETASAAAKDEIEAPGNMEPMAELVKFMKAVME